MDELSEEDKLTVARARKVYILLKGSKIPFLTFLHV
jgi:F0F1-type ATP synthase beta subunit